MNKKVILKAENMPEKKHKTRIFCSTGKAHFFKYRSPKLKYIQDPAEFVDNNYKNEYSQFLIPYDVMSVRILPLWGPYSGKQISLTYDWDNVKVTFNEQEQETDVMFLKPGISPDQFVRLSMAVCHGAPSCEICLPLQRFHQPLSLVTLCLQSVVLIQQSELFIKCIPKELQSFFSYQTKISIRLQVWPNYSVKAHSLSINVQDIVVAELYWIVRSLLKIDSMITVKLYQNFVPLDEHDVLTDSDEVHCVVIHGKAKRSGSQNTLSKKYVLNKVGPKTFEISGKEILVVSLINKGTKEIPISLSDSLTTLDMAIRKAFQLNSSSFLAFKNPTEERFILQASKDIKTHIDEEKVKILLQNKRRNFPCRGTMGISVKQLFKDSPFYQKSLKALGFYPGCYVEVFEVTGPTLPVMLLGKAVESRALDVNPTWPLKVFLYYLKLCAASGESFSAIDCVGGNLKRKTVKDLMNVMGFLCPYNKGALRFEYIKVRFYENNDK